MSPLLQSLVNEVQDPPRADLDAMADLIRRRLQALPGSSQRALLAEVTQWRNRLAPAIEPQWSQQQVIFQLLWQVIGAPTVECADENALRTEIRKSNPPPIPQPNVVKSAG